MSNKRLLQEGLGVLRKQKKMLVLFLIVISLISISWIFAPEKTIEKTKEVVDNEKVNFNVELDTLKISTSAIFSTKEEEVENNPYEKEVKDEDLNKSVEALENLGTTKKVDPYKNDNMWKINKENVDNNSSLSLSNENNEEESEGIVVYTPDDNNNESSGILENGSQTFSAQIAGKQIVSKKQPYARIMLLEDMKIGALTVPKFSYLSAEAKFDESRVFFTIRNITLGKNVHSVNIVVLDSHGYEGMPIKGGTGAKVQGDAAQDAYDNAIINSGNNNVPGRRSIGNLFRKEPKARLNSDKVKLKISFK